MNKKLSGSPVPRRAVFILADGSFVVQWDEGRVQELLSGRYRKIEDSDYGHAITNYELNQLKAAGRVEHYDQRFVWLYALPETNRFNHELKLYTSSNRVRSYYLNTTLPRARIREVQAALASLGLDKEYLARERGDLIAVLGRNGAPFRHLKDAERAQKHLIAHLPELLQHTAIAFIETTSSYKQQTEVTAAPVDLEAIIASQTDVSITTGRRVVVVTSSHEERDAICGLLGEMKMEAHCAATGLDGLQALQDYEPHLMIMDFHLPDMHGWELLAKIKEIDSLSALPIIVIADHSASSDDQAFALTVAKVEVYLIRPISMAQLRQNMWLTLKNTTYVS
ncbi:MAG: response regulator [Aggregatilineales bacterium]